MRGGIFSRASPEASRAPHAKRVPTIINFRVTPAPLRSLAGSLRQAAPRVPRTEWLIREQRRAVCVRNAE